MPLRRSRFLGRSQRTWVLLNPKDLRVGVRWVPGDAVYVHPFPFVVLVRKAPVTAAAGSRIPAGALL